MIAKKKMDDYNWPDLYRQADEFMRQYIPETMIHARYRLLFDGRPAVTVHFPEKGHKQELNLLQKKACFRRIRGTTVNGVRLIYANIYFTADGSRIYPSYLMLISYLLFPILYVKPIFFFCQSASQ